MNYRLIINVTQFGAKVGDSEAEELLYDFIEWLECGSDYDLDPRDFFGQEHTFPLVKESSNEELGGIFNCNEWKIDVDSELVALTAMALYHDGEIEKNSLELMYEGKPVSTEPREFIDFMSQGPYADAVMRLLRMA